MRSLSAFVFIFALSSVFGGCVYSRSAQLKALKASEDQNQPQETRLQVGDRVHVTVFGEDKITGDYELDADGKIALPLAGTVKAADLTKAALEASLQDKLKRDYLKDPKVSVGMVSFRPFYVLGEVEKPGEYAYKNGLNLWRAIAMAGGQTYRASSSTVLLQHPGTAQWHEYDLSTDHLIDPGDLIRVPERWF